MAEKTKKPVTTRKQLVGVERERVVNRFLLIAIGVIVLAVFGLVSWGLIQENVITPRTIVAVVEGEEIDGREFQGRVRSNRQQMIGTYIQLVQNYQIFGADPGLGQQILGQINQIQFQLQPATMGITTINQLVDDRLIELEAQKLGVEVSEEQVEEDLQNFFGYYTDSTPVPTEVPTQVPTSTLSETQLAIVTLTLTPSPVPSVTPTMPDEDESEASATPTEEGEPSPTPTALPTATAYTFEGYEEVFQNYLEAQETDIGLTEEDLRTIIRKNLYRNALFELITVDIPAEQEQVWARHILVEDEETALQVLEELENDVDWTSLVADYSLDPSNQESGGDLGWFPFENMVTPFAEAAFELEIGEISEPVESSFGWHIIQALGHEMRPLSGQEYAQVRNSVFQDYVQDLRNDYEWEIFDTWFDITPDDPEIPFEYRLTQ